MSLEPGYVLGPYEIIAFLGAGGMGEVYCARDVRLARDVALKILPADASPRRVRRFQLEASTLAAVAHPNIVSVYDVGETEGIHYLVTELLQGESLKEKLHESHLPVSRAVALAVEAAEALDAAHGQGIVHRDIKPGNLFLQRDGHLKVLDFGLAGLTDEMEDDAEGASSPATEEDGSLEKVRTASGPFLGTVDYMSPEQSEGAKADHRSDIFSLGVVLYQMLAGRHPFRGETPTETLSAIRGADPPPLGMPPGGATPSLERIVARCLEKEPGDRFQSARDLAHALEATTSHQETAARWGGLPRARVVVGLAVLASAVMLVRWAGARRADGLSASRASAAQHSAMAPSRSDLPFPPVPLTSSRGLEYFPAMSPDGQHLAYLWNGEAGGGHFDLYSKAVGSDATLRLTSRGTQCCAAWSPDRRFIAFLRLHGVEGTILVIPAAGGAERRVADVATWFGSALSWSRDGTELAVSDRGSPSEPFGVTLVAVGDGRKRRLTVPGPENTGDAFAKFSPDGRQLAFARLRASGDVTAGDLYVISATGGKPRALTSDSRFIGDLDWGPGGEDVFFYSNRFSNHTIDTAVRLWRVPLSGEPTLLWPDGQPHDIAAIDTFGETPMEISRLWRFSSARSMPRLAVTSFTNDTNILRLDPGTPAGGDAPSRPLIGSSANDDSPQLSPDDRRVAFSTMRSGFQEIWTCDLDGSKCGPLVTAIDGGTPRWSPDGRFIAYDASPNGQSDIYSVELATRLALRLTYDEADDRVPSWSRDGRSVYFASDRTGSFQVFKVPAGGGAAVQVTHEGGYAAFETFGGELLLYTKFLAAGLFRVPVGGGPEERVLDQPRCWGQFAVVKDGVLYLDTTLRTAPVLFFQRLEGGVAEKVASMGVAASCAESSLAASPDRRILLYGAIEERSDIVQIDGVR